MIQTFVVPPRSAAKRLLGHGYATLSSLILFPTLLLVNGVQMASLVLLPFSRRLFRRVNRGCASFWWGMARWWTEGLYGIHAVFSGDTIPVEENAMVVVNHQQMSDIIALFTFAWRKRRLGDLKFVVKEVLKYVPGVGWGMLFLDCLFLKRNWEADQTYIQRTFAKFKTEAIPIWLVSFSEGTRIKPAKLEKSREYAKKANLPVLSNVLLPRTKGFAAAVEGLRGHIAAVYDVTIAYPTGIPSLWQMLQGYTREFHLHVRRFAIEGLPTDREALASWLVARWEEKDRLLQRFHERGAFPARATDAVTRSAGAAPIAPWGGTEGIVPG